MRVVCITLVAALAACSHAPAPIAAPTGDAPAASLADFPLADDPSHPIDYVDVAELRRFAANSEVDAATFAAAVASHARFLEAGGAGGGWQRMILSNMVMGLYLHGSGGDGAQARFEMSTLAPDVVTRGVRLPWSSFCASNLAERDFGGAELSGALMSDADLNGARFRGATLRHVDFSDSELRGADFRDADLQGADFERADLTGADFRGADLTGSRFPGAKLAGVKR